jgi:predicted glutamine amidotransferase
MCGIVGIAGNMYGREELTMKRLLLLDSLRGMDSTGMAAVKMGGNTVPVSKRASHCFNLFDTKSFCEALNGCGSVAFIGHNRSATSGLIRDTNAHPFQIGDITGVHNGTLEDSDKKMLEEWVGEKFNVDSEALFAAIAKFGAKEVIPKLSKGRDHFKGAWSLVWWDKSNKTLNFLRNSHRPLWYCFSKDFKLLFWASEFWMLDVALQKASNYDLYQQESKDTAGKFFRFFQTKEDVLYTIDIEKLSKGSKERPKFTAVELKGKEPEAAKETSYPFVGTSSVQRGNVCGIGTVGKTHTKPSTKTTTAAIRAGNISSGEPRVIHMQGDLGNPYAGYFTKTGFAFLGNTRSSTNGEPQCSWCHGDVPYGQPGLCIYTRDNVILCAKCNGQEVVSMLSDFAPATRVYLPRVAFNGLR